MYPGRSAAAAIGFATLMPSLRDSSVVMAGPIPEAYASGYQLPRLRRSGQGLRRFGQGLRRFGQGFCRLGQGFCRLGHGSAVQSLKSTLQQPKSSAEPGFLFLRKSALRL